MRFQAITIKTLKDMFSLRRSLLFLFAALIVPFIGTQIFVEAAQLPSMTLAMQNQMMVGFFLILSFLWIAGIPLVMLASVTCGDFISKEDQDGTLLLLVSKPVRRHEIVIGKFLAFLISAMLLELTALSFSVSLVAAHVDPYILDNIVGMMPVLFLYSVFVAFVFGTLATALSSLFKSRMKTIMVLVAVTILIYFGFMIARGWLGAAYEGYMLNYLDVNYHLGNSYLLFVESTGFRMMPIYQGIMGQFTGTYDAADIGKLFDRDIGAMPPSLEPKAYVTPAASMAIWIGLALALLALGIFKFERREIN